MTSHSVNNNTRMGLVVSLCSNSNHLISLGHPPPPTASNFRHLLSCGTIVVYIGVTADEILFIMSYQAHPVQQMLHASVFVKLFMVQT